MDIAVLLFKYMVLDARVLDLVVGSAAVLAVLARRSVQRWV